MNPRKDLQKLTLQIALNYENADTFEEPVERLDFVFNQRLRNAFTTCAPL